MKRICVILFFFILGDVVVLFPERTLAATNQLEMTGTIRAIRFFASSDNPSREGTNVVAPDCCVCKAHTLIPQDADFRVLIKAPRTGRCVSVASVLGLLHALRRPRSGGIR